MNRIARNTALQIGAELVSKLAALVLFAVLARELGRRGFGEFAVVTSIAVLLVSLPALGTEDIVARNVARDVDVAPRMLWHALILELALGVIAVAAAVTAGLLADYSTAVRIALGLVAVASLIELVTTTVYATFRGIGDLLPEAVGSSLLRITRSGLGITVVLAGGGIIGIGAVYVVAAGISGAYAARRLRRISALGRPHVSRRQLRTLVRDSSLVALRDLFEAGALSATILILSSLKGNSSAALLGAAGRLALSIEFVGAAYTVSLLPSLVRAARAGGRQLGRVYETGCRVLVAALLPLSAWCALSARTIARIVFGSGFAAAAGSIRWISATIVLLALSRLATDALVARDRQRLVALFAGLAMVVNLGLSVVLSHSLGAPGGAIALLVAESTFLVFTAAVIARIVEAVSWRRMGLGPAAATAGMCAAVAPLGDSVARLLSAPIVYLVVLYVAERLSNPDDVARVVGWISYSLRYSADAHRRIARRP